MTPGGARTCLQCSGGAELDLLLGALVPHNMYKY
jgi:hypothetical protein